MNELAAVVTAADAAGSSAAGPAAGSSGSSAAARAREGWLDAQDPIVSPGRITLASKVKAARLYSGAGAKGGASRTDRT
jgi:hypothetical protein